jgi:hypothetical protein
MKILFIDAMKILFIDAMKIFPSSTAKSRSGK